MSDQLFYIFSAVLLGLVIGALIMYFATGSNKDSEQTIAKLEKELEDYQKDVVDHFEQTADLVDGMTQSYKKVFDHLGKSARKLMTEEQIQQQMELRKGNKVTLEYLTDTADELDTSTDAIHELVEDDNDVSIVSESNSEPETDSIDTQVIQSDEDQIDSDTSHDDELIAEVNANNEVDDEDKDEDGITEKVKDLEKEVEMREKNIYS